MPRPLKFKQRLDRYPPILCRLLSRVEHDAEIILRAGLTMSGLKSIEYATNWTDITIGEYDQFMHGCGIDLENRAVFRRLEWMRRNGTFSHLRKSPLWASQLAEMVEIYLESINE